MDDTPRSASLIALRDFVHNFAFSFLIGPLINGMSFAINHKRFSEGVKEVIGSARGWKCNTLLAIIVGSVGTVVNALFGTGKFTRVPASERPATIMMDVSSAQVSSGHAAREEARRAEVSHSPEMQR